MNKVFKKVTISIVSIIMIISMSISLFACGSIKHKAQIAALETKWNETENKEANSKVKTTIRAKMDKTGTFDIDLEMTTKRKFENKKLTIESDIEFTNITATGIFSTVFSQLNLSSKNYIEVLKPNDKLNINLQAFSEGLSIKFNSEPAIQDIKGTKIHAKVEIPNILDKKVIISDVNLKLSEQLNNQILLKYKGVTDVKLNNFYETVLIPIFEKKLVIEEGSEEFNYLDSFGIISSNISSYKDLSGYDISNLDSDLDKKTGAVETIQGQNVSYKVKNPRIYMQNSLDKIQKILTNSETKSVLNNQLKTLGIDVDTIVQLMLGEKQQIDGLTYAWGPSINFDFKLNKDLPKKYDDISLVPSVKSLKAIQNDAKITIKKAKIIETANKSLQGEEELSPELKKQIKEYLNGFSDIVITINSSTEENYEY